MLLILGHEPIKGALLLHELSLILLLIGLPGANLRSLWNKCAQNTNTRGVGAVGTKGVGSADLAEVVAESAKPTP